MKKVLIDSNVILDVFSEDERWFGWSANQIETLTEDHVLVINPIIYAEVSVGMENIEDLEKALPSDQFLRFPLPWEAAFLAGKAFVSYKKNGGKRNSTMTDFFIGAHAAVSDMLLLTRDVARYQTYFPKLQLLTPEMGATH